MCVHRHKPYTELQCPTCRTERLEVNMGTRDKPRWEMACKCTVQMGAAEAMAEVIQEWHLSILRRLAVGNPYGSLLP